MSKKHVKPSESDVLVCAATKESEAKGEPATRFPPTTPEGRIAAVEAEKAEIYERMLHIAADFENWKKRAQREQAEGEKHAKESVLRDFLEIADSLERATELWADGKESDTKSVRNGIELVLRQFRSKLERYQVKPMEAVGLPFDPRVHEAVSQVPSTAVRPGAILQELQKGYLIGEKLLRPTLVVVASAPSAA